VRVVNNQSLPSSTLGTTFEPERLAEWDFCSTTTPELCGRR
jgi:hypothetical protein